MWPGLHQTPASNCAAGSLWFEAGACFARAGVIERAMLAYQKVLSIDPELAEQRGVLERLNELAALTR